MIAGDFNRDPSTITNTVDRELANKIRVVFPTSATQANGGLLIMQLQAIKQTTSLYSTTFNCDFDACKFKIIFQLILENFRTFNIKKLLLYFLCL